MSADASFFVSMVFITLLFVFETDKAPERRFALDRMDYLEEGGYYRNAHGYAQQGQPRRFTPGGGKSHVAGDYAVHGVVERAAGHKNYYRRHQKYRGRSFEYAGEDFGNHRCKERGDEVFQKHVARILLKH